VLAQSVLHRFDSDGAEVETLIIGGGQSGGSTRLTSDRGGTALQTTFSNSPKFPTLPESYWWRDGHAVEPIGLTYVDAHAASGDHGHPRATMLGPLGWERDLWVAWRRGDGVWSRRFVTTRADIGDNFPEDPIDGQIFVRHVREVHAIAVVVDPAGTARWIWSEIERDEPWVAHVGEVSGWSLTFEESTGTSALWIGWLGGGGEVNARLLSDSPAARTGDAAIDDTGTLHLLVLAGPIWQESFDLRPIYLQLSA
jgi:hypothetical protein